MWEYRRKVRYYETDRMGVVHHSNYLRIAEDARFEWIKENIMNYGDMEKMGIVIPCSGARESFNSFLRFDDSFVVKVRLYKYTGVRMYFDYEIYNTETGELCYKGETVHYFTVDQERYKPCTIKRSFPDLHEKFIKAVEEKDKK